MEADSRVKRLFCSFYENDSSDDTPEYLPKWFKARQCLLHSERLGAPRLHCCEISRVIRMVAARSIPSAGFGD